MTPDVLLDETLNELQKGPRPTAHLVEGPVGSLLYVHVLRDPPQDSGDDLIVDHVSGDESRPGFGVDYLGQTALWLSRARP